MAHQAPTSDSEPLYSVLFIRSNELSGRPPRTDHEVNLEIAEALGLSYDFVASNGQVNTDTPANPNVRISDVADIMEATQANAGSSSATAGGHHSAIPPPLPPSVEEAYKRKCIELRRRKQDVEATNNGLIEKAVKLKRAIRKQRLLKAILLEKLREILDAEQNAEGGEHVQDGEAMEGGGVNGDGMNGGGEGSAAMNGDGEGAGQAEYNGVGGDDLSEMDST